MQSVHTSEAASQSTMFPSTSQEFINLVAHYYRGEIARMSGWRDRIDRTTNWAVTCVAAMLSFSWSGSHHEIVLFGMIIVLLLLAIESRRYRFFDVYRRRVRMIERHYYAQVFDLEIADSGWTRDLATNLRQPIFVISWRGAFCRRLRRNYIWIFLTLLAGWILQIFRVDPLEKTALAKAAIGPLSGIVIVACVAAFYTVLLFMSFVRPKSDEDIVSGHAHV